MVIWLNFDLDTCPALQSWLHEMNLKIIQFVCVCFAHHLCRCITDLFNFCVPKGNECAKECDRPNERKKDGESCLLISNKLPNTVHNLITTISWNHYTVSSSWSSSSSLRSFPFCMHITNAVCKMSDSWLIFQQRHKEEKNESTSTSCAFTANSMWRGAVVCCSFIMCTFTHCVWGGRQCTVLSHWLFGCCCCHCCGGGSLMSGITMLN